MILTLQIRYPTVSKSQKSFQLANDHGEFVGWVYSPIAIERTLGVLQDAGADKLLHRLDTANRPVSRWENLSPASSWKDPVMFISLWLLPGKILPQRLYRRKFGLGDPIDPEVNLFWENFPTSGRGLGSITHMMHLSKWRKSRKDLQGFSEA